MMRLTPASFAALTSRKISCRPRCPVARIISCLAISSSHCRAAFWKPDNLVARTTRDPQRDGIESANAVVQCNGAVCFDARHGFGDDCRAFRRRNVVRFQHEAFQLAAALPNLMLAVDNQQLNLTGDIVDEPHRIERGSLRVPNGAGLGGRLS